MKKILAASAVATALLAGSALPSFASTATYNLGSVNDSTTFNLGGPVGTKETGTFTDYYNFSLGLTAQVTLASITNSFVQASQNIKNFAVTLFNGTSTAIGTQIAMGDATTQYTNVKKTSGFQFGSLESDNLGLGNYVLRVSGQTGSASYGGSLAISVSTVPLPSTVALFGVALAGLGVAGAMRRKSATSAA